MLQYFPLKKILLTQNPTPQLLSHFSPFSQIPKKEIVCRQYICFLTSHPSLTITLHTGSCLAFPQASLPDVNNQPPDAKSKGLCLFSSYLTSQHHLDWSCMPFRNILIPRLLWHQSAGFLPTLPAISYSAGSPSSVLPIRCESSKLGSRHWFSFPTEGNDIQVLSLNYHLYANESYA